MTPELVATFAPYLLAAIRERLANAVAAAEAAEAQVKRGALPAAIATALDIEVQTYEANVLLSALSLINRDLSRA